ncbi:extracellular calcium-sensing receptor-like [Discoglossus pictus]
MRRLLQALLLLLSSLDEGYSDNGCRLKGWEMDPFSWPGDVLIGGVFVVHSGYECPKPTFQDLPQPATCQGFHIRYYRDILGLIFAIDEINKSSDLLPNITLGFSLIDSCMSELRAIGGALSLLSGISPLAPRYDCHTPNVMIGMVGDMMSALSLPIARILGVLNYPQISPGASLSFLSDKTNFPSFLRTVSSNMFQNIALSQLVGQFGWTWVGMLVVDNDVGEQGGQVIRAGIEKRGSCVAFLEKIHLSYTMRQIQSVVDIIKRSTVTVIVIHSPEVHVKALLDALYDKDVTGKVFITSASFAITPGLFSKKAWKLLNGTIGLIPKTGDMPGFEAFLHNLHPTRGPQYPFIKLFWERTFGCKWLDGETREHDTLQHNISNGAFCTGDEDLGELIPGIFEITDLTYTYHSHLAVYAYAHALQALLSSQNAFGDVRITQPWQVLHYLKKTPFQARTGNKISFDMNGDISASYDIMNIQVLNNNFHVVKVGTFSAGATWGNKLLINTSAILWSDKSSRVPSSVCSNQCHPGFRRITRQGQAICCYDCVPCSAGEISNVTDAVECIRCPTDQWSSEERDRCIPKVIEYLSYQEPLGFILAAMVIVFSILALFILSTFIRYQDTPMVKATNRELSFILLVSLIFCFLCCLVFIGRPSNLTCLLRQSIFSVVFSISISSVLAKTIMVILAFKATNPNSPLRKWLGPGIPRHVVGMCFILQATMCSVWLITSPPFPKLDMESKNHKMTFECYEGHKFFFYMTMGFMAFLAMVSFVVAFLARNLPDRFNEAKLITFSMVVFCSVWVSFIPAYLSTNGKYMVVVQIFAILASSAGLLGCIFVPKCYIILLKPERNNRGNLAVSKSFGLAVSPDISIIQ